MLQPGDISSYRQSRLFQAGFDRKLYPGHEEKTEYFFQALESFRARVTPLVATVSHFLPGFTDHSIEHLDALWEMADLVAGREVTLENPAEAFVFGGAVLLHDAALTLAAYPGGIQELEQTEEWSSAVRQLQRLDHSRDLDPAYLALKRDEIVGMVLRIRHALHAEQLACQDFGRSEFLIEDSGLRRSYAVVIGKIARSHWLPVSQLRQYLPSGFRADSPAPPDWKVNPLKLACLLRLADATHIDHRRSPSLRRVFQSPSGYSKLHWDFQEKLRKPVEENDLFVYASRDSFRYEDAEAWWLCYEVIRMADSELRAVDRLLQDYDIILGPHSERFRFAIRGIRGVDDPTALARTVETIGWKPIDARIRVSNLPALIKTLAGERLFGYDDGTPIRELLQNAMDAIRLRRALEGRAPDWGEILIKIRGPYSDMSLEIADTGVGMSERVLTEVLANFGASIWSSPILDEEFDGLSLSGLETAGEFGFGFFSVFMLSDRVTVKTRKVSEISPTLVLEFRHGLEHPPLLREATRSERLIEPGTRIRAQLSKSGTFRTNADRSPWLKGLLRELLPASDVNVYVDVHGKELTVSAGGWQDCPAAELFGRATGWRDVDAGSLAPYARNLRLVKDSGGRVWGRACLGRINGIKAVLHTSGLRIPQWKLDPPCMGVLQGRPTTVSRAEGELAIPKDVWLDWIAGQCELWAETEVNDGLKMRIADAAARFGADTGPLPIVVRGNTPYTRADLKRHAAKLRRPIVVSSARTAGFWELSEASRETEFIVKDLNFDEAFRGHFGRMRHYESLLGCIQDALCDGWGVDSCWIAVVVPGLLFSVDEIDPKMYILPEDKHD